MITHAEADIFEYGPRCCDGLIVWGRDGLNQLRATYSAFALRIEGTVQADGGHVVLGARPWATEVAARVLTLAPPCGRLQALYFLANPRDELGLPDASFRGALEAALDALAREQATAVALNGAPALDRVNTGDAERVRLTRAIVSDWLATHPGSSVREIHLVSLDEAFVRA
jgi:hypothetical protein